MQNGKCPQHIYVLFKKPTEVITDELAQFKMDFSMKYSSIPCYTFNKIKQLREYVTNVLLIDKLGIN